jgi:hypothetical protein
MVEGTLAQGLIMAAGIILLATADPTLAAQGLPIAVATT